MACNETEFIPVGTAIEILLSVLDDQTCNRRHCSTSSDVRTLAFVDTCCGYFVWITEKYVVINVL